MSIFGATKALEGEISNFHNVIQNTSLLFYEGVKDYFAGDMEKFEKRVVQIQNAEREADSIAAKIKHQLYAYMLIPDSRGDVHDLIGSLDDVIDVAKKTILSFSIEKPEIPECLREDFIKMADFSIKCIDELIKASNAFFTAPSTTGEHINKIKFFEHEVDVLEEHLKREAFTLDIQQFSKRVHIRYFTEKMAMLSDAAEDVSDKLAVFVIKRSI
ncbi:MAG: TIGR00153 family protein [Bacteriovoracaceae bacterium]|nr:TIGR00153 family protein [Bacteriovoracaceae bacterium]